MVTWRKKGKPRGKPQGTPSCVICRAALARGEGRQCNLCLEVVGRIHDLHGCHVKAKLMGPEQRVYRAMREAEQAERIAREMALLR